MEILGWFFIVFGVVIAAMTAVYFVGPLLVILTIDRFFTANYPTARRELPPEEKKEQLSATLAIAFWLLLAALVSLTLIVTGIDLIGTVVPQWATYSVAILMFITTCAWVGMRVTTPRM